MANITETALGAAVNTTRSAFGFVANGLSAKVMGLLCCEPTESSSTRKKRSQSRVRLAECKFWQLFEFSVSFVFFLPHLSLSLCLHPSLPPVKSMFRALTVSTRQAQRRMLNFRIRPAA